MSSPDTDRAQVAALGGYVEQPTLADGDYIAPIGFDPTKPGPIGYCWSDGDGLYSIHWFDQYGDFMHRQPAAPGPVPKGYRHVTGPRPKAPRPPEPQPAPVPGEGDVWQEVIDAEPLAMLRELYEARRALGLRRYGHLLQRDNGRDHALDGQEELLDGIAYFTAAGWYDVVAALRTALLCVVARRGAA